MITNANAGRRWLERATPDLDEAKTAFKRIITDGHRAGAVIGSIRAMFKKEVQTRSSLGVYELIWEFLALMRGELQTHRVSVQAEPNERLPRVKGDRVQLQQVLLNLIANAIDAMAAKDGARLLSVNATFTTPAEWWYRWRTLERELTRRKTIRYSIPSSRQEPTAWGWGCRFAARLSRRMKGGYGLGRTGSQVRSFSFSCPLILRCPLAYLSKLTLPRLTPRIELSR